MSALEQFSDITQFDEPLGPLTWLKVGGPVQMLISPESVDQLQQIVQAANSDGVPVRILGGGSNLLVSQDGISGLVLHLNHESFKGVEVDGNRVRAGGGALLSNVISIVVENELAGLEELVGIPGTIGAAVKGNAGSRHADIGEFVKSVDVMTATGELSTRTGDELSFSYRQSSINELVVLGVELEFKPGDTLEIAQRMKTTWITKKASQPLSFQSAGCIFKNPRGMSAGSLIEEAGLKGTKVGQAEVSDRHANFIVTNEGATANDVLNLIELIRSRVHETHQVDLDLEIAIWK